MKLNDIIEGLIILRPYYESGGNGYYNGAEHDQFFSHATDRPLSVEDVEQMHYLGWFQPEVDDDGDGSSGPYDPEEGWSFFT